MTDLPDLHRKNIIGIYNAYLLVMKAWAFTVKLSPKMLIVTIQNLQKEIFLKKIDSICRIRLREWYRYIVCCFILLNAIFNLGNNGFNAHGYNTIQNSSSHATGKCQQKISYCFWFLACLCHLSCIKYIISAKIPILYELQL